MRNIVWIAAAGLAVGCAMGGHETKPSETVSAQSQASQSFQAAADAQKRATDEQQKAEKAHQDVIQAQKALADAQARERGQQAKADQAQADAQRLASAANQQGNLSQQQAAQNQQVETQQHQQVVQQNQSWTQAQEARGTVIGAESGSLAVRTDDSQTLNLGINESTAVTLDGRQASASQLMPGTEVRASYQMVDGKAQALRIRARSNNAIPSSTPQQQPQ
jgi:methylphosphotriester-DNA--protein-cysteine methyltransferase